MFGTNPIRKQELRTDGQLWVQELFRTFQGEGPLAGTPAVFIRFAGCNLACRYCDTDFEGGSWMHVDEILAVAASLAQGWKNPLFVLTGGEPFRQDIAWLVNGNLSNLGRVQIETAGTLWIRDVALAADIVVSPKTGKLNPYIVQRAKAWKYIVRAGEVDEHDGLPNIMPGTGRPGLVARPPRGAEVFVQPCDDHDEERNKANLETAKSVALRFGYRLSLQQHKLLGVP